MIRLIFVAFIVGIFVVIVLERTPIGERVGETSDRVFETPVATSSVGTSTTSTTSTLRKPIERAQQAIERVEEAGRERLRESMPESYN